MACRRCNTKPEFSTYLDTRYALVDDPAEAEHPENIPSWQKFDSAIEANRMRIKYPNMRVAVIREYRRL